MSDQTDQAGQIIKTLIQAVVRGGYSLQNVPRLLRQVIEGNLWKSFAVNAQDKVQEYEHFEQFVAAKVPFGLETNVETLLALCWNQGRRDVADMVDALLTRPAGRPKEQTVVELPTPEVSNDPPPAPAQDKILYNVQDKPVPLTKAPTGNTREAGIRRLRETAKKLEAEGEVDKAAKLKELHEQVIRKEKSVHQASREAGFRKEYIPIRTDDLVSAAKTLANKFGKDKIKELIEILKEYIQEQ